METANLAARDALAWGLVYLDACLRQRTPQEAADLLGFPMKYIMGVCCREIRPSVEFAARVAICSGIELAAILTG